VTALEVTVLVLVMLTVVTLEVSGNSGGGGDGNGVLRRLNVILKTHRHEFVFLRTLS
jgi:hypothetical protein